PHRTVTARGRVREDPWIIWAFGTERGSCPALREALSKVLLIFRAQSVDQIIELRALGDLLEFRLDSPVRLWLRERQEQAHPERVLRDELVGCHRVVEEMDRRREELGVLLIVVDLGRVARLGSVGVPDDEALEGPLAAPDAQGVGDRAADAERQRDVRSG